MEHTRIVIYAKDVQRITGKSESYSRRIIRRIRRAFGKEKHQMITLGEFCSFMKCDADEIITYLKN
jgi:hypothetical protein